MNLLDKCADIYGEHVVLPVCPSVMLQKDGASICLCDLPTYTEMMEHHLSKAKTT